MKIEKIINSSFMFFIFIFIIMNLAAFLTTIINVAKDKIKRRMWW